MPTPPDQGSPQDRPTLEPIRVLRPRRTDALAELIREYREQNGIYDRDQNAASERERNRAYEAVALSEASTHAEEETQELPPLAPVRPPARRGAPRDRPRHLRRMAVVGAVAAAVVGFGCAFLLPGRGDATAAPAPVPPAAATSASPTPPSSAGAADPDGAGTLREGSAGPEVTDLAELFGSQTGDRTDKFEHIRWQEGPKGAIVLADAAAWYVGAVLLRADAGDHVGFVLDRDVSGPAAGTATVVAGG